MVKGNIPEQAPEVNLEEIAQFVQQAEAKIKELVRASASLPKVEGDGSSECPFAEQLYAKKAGVHAEVQGLIAQLQQYLLQLNAEIHKCTSQHGLITGNASRLHGAEARGHFSQAQLALEERHMRCVELRNRVQRALKIAEATMQAAAAKQFPGGQPRDEFGFPAPKPRPTGGPLEEPLDPSEADEMLDRLLQLDGKRVGDSRRGIARPRPSMGQADNER